MELLLHPRGARISSISLSNTVFCMAAAFPPGVLFSISLVRVLSFPLTRCPSHVTYCYFRALLAPELPSTVSSPYDYQSYASSSVCQTSLLFYLSVTFSSSGVLSLVYQLLLLLYILALIKSISYAQCFLH